MCPVFANYTPAIALQLRKKHEKNLSQGRKESLLLIFDIGPLRPKRVVRFRILIIEPTGMLWPMACLSLASGPTYTTNDLARHRQTEQN